MRTTQLSQRGEQWQLTVYRPGEKGEGGRSTVEYNLTTHTTSTWGKRQGESKAKSKKHKNPEEKEAIGEGGESGGR